MLAGLAACCVLASATAGAQSGSDTLGQTTLDQKIVGDGDPDFQQLSLGPGEGYVVREDGIGTAEAGRAQRRESLLYFGQLSDFQLADEESPARVEFLDFGPFSSAWRTNEALLAHQADAMIRQLNAFTGASPVPSGDGTSRPMDFTINTGDAADSQQLNETRWVRTLAEGGTLAPGSGVDPATSGNAICGLLAPLIADANAPQKYTGVQDFDDFVEGPLHQYYDPDHPSGAHAQWPSYPNLMDAAQAPFEAAGLDVPHYLTFGNHDALVQGNAAANVAYELVATGCIKPMSPLTGDMDTLAEALAGIDLSSLLSTLSTDPAKVALVPPDPARQFVSKKQYKRVFLDGNQADGHGFGFIDPAEESASRGAAGYYAWNPEPGIRFIALDTVSEAGVIGPSSDGNIDDPQFQWLRGEIAEAEAADELVILFSHHAIPSLSADVPDELAPPCLDTSGDDVNAGCDLDPRNSAPLHLGDDMTAYLHQHPNVIAWVGGHSHQNTVDPFPNPSGDGGFWSIRVAAEADWPQQSRLLEIFDNGDGTLSLFGTILDHASPATAAAPGSDATGMDVDALASLGRTIGYNDGQYGAEGCNPTCEGGPDDRNVELLIADPRRGSDPDPDPDPDPVEDCTEVIAGTAGADYLVGTPGSERILGRRGKDRLRGLAGNDCLNGGRGDDRIDGGAGKDELKGARGKDRVLANDGERDFVSAGRGNDVVRATDGKRDIVRCGRGKNDRAFLDEFDRARGCELVAVAIP